MRPLLSALRHHRVAVVDDEPDARLLLKGVAWEIATGDPLRLRLHAPVPVRDTARNTRRCEGDDPAAVVAAVGAVCSDDEPASVPATRTPTVIDSTCWEFPPDGRGPACPGQAGVSASGPATASKEWPQAQV